MFYKNLQIKSTLRRPYFRTSLIKQTLLVVLCLSLVACSTKPKIQAIQAPVTQNIEYSDWLIAEFNPLNSTKPFQLRADQKEKFLAYYNDPKYSHIRPHQRLYDYLSRFVFYFTYQNHTHDASEAFDHKSGNCMSLAMLTTALANAVNLEIGYQMVNTAPLFYREGNTAITSYHVRTKIYIQEETQLEDEEYFYFNRSSLTIDYYRDKSDLPGKMISNDEFISMYFANKAAKAIAEKDYELAYQYSSNSLKHFPSAAENINTHALVLSKLNHLEKAIELYKTASESDITSINMMSNYKNLLVRAGEFAKATEVEKQLKTLDDDNPYDLIMQGNHFFEQAEYSASLVMYQKAENKAPYLDEVHFSQAKAYFKIGKFAEAKASLKKAMSAPVKVNSVDLYHAKLQSFKR